MLDTVITEVIWSANDPMGLSLGWCLVGYGTTVMRPGYVLAGGTWYFHEL